ncbi:Tetratricopeptide repeat-containing protein [Tenacibaculum sp. MAR_2009_124]|uniref:ATP-binding protein n=1 Tax=Tenacibaculum sp. MAR_2009_124 TaxID=1250059 RepID=UPI0008970580|nr:tetratricopeptide repeat-containing sensor histidine kinase [Tenacibaculum sp. MAR_2009_124]SED08757.1 Tetratricopeptide repeat-containing protein [Tenacibaculum sp. MAR_2009_124]
MIRLYYLFFFFLCNGLIGQQKDKLYVDHIEIEISVYFDQLDFKKAFNFFKLREWDSVLVYSNKQLIRDKNESRLLDYCHFFRGYSFKRKKVFNQAKRELELISNNFEFNILKFLSLGDIALEKNKFEKAVVFFQNVMNAPNRKKILVNKNSIIHNLGLCYLYLKKFDKAEKYLNESILYKEKNKDTLNLIGAYGNIANLYYEQYKDDLAIPYFEKAYSLSKKLKINQNDLTRSQLNNKKRLIFKNRRISSKNMAVVEENRKNFNKALVYRKEMERWVDSLNNQNTIYAVAEKEKEFAVQQKQKEVDLLHIKNELQETQRNIFLYSAVGLLILLGGSLYFYREKVKNNRIITEQKETLDELNATKDKLFSIVSHDLRSSVNALKNSNKILVSNLESKNLIALEDLLKKNSAIVNGAYGLLDNLLNWALLQTKQQYFYIEKQRLFIIAEHVSYNYQPLLLEKELSFENTVSKKNVVYADQESLKIVLRNLLDNAIKFSKTRGSIKIYTRNTSENYCDLVIEDTGLGMSEETRLKLLEDNVLLNKKEHEDVIGTGLGLQLCKSMITKNNGKFDIESELGKGTKMIVSLPKIPLNG